MLHKHWSPEKARTVARKHTTSRRGGLRLGGFSSWLDCGRVSDSTCAPWGCFKADPRPAVLTARIREREVGHEHRCCRLASDQTPALRADCSRLLASAASGPVSACALALAVAVLEGMIVSRELEHALAQTAATRLLGVQNPAAQSRMV